MTQTNTKQHIFEKSYCIMYEKCYNGYDNSLTLTPKGQK
jgi:hypothetical protein